MPSIPSSERIDTRAVVGTFTMTLESTPAGPPEAADRCGQLLHAALTESLSQILARTLDMNEHMNIDMLKLDLGTLRYRELTWELPHRLENELRRALGELPARHSVDDAAVGAWHPRRESITAARNTRSIVRSRWRNESFTPLGEYESQSRVRQRRPPLDDRQIERYLLSAGSLSSAAHAWATLAALCLDRAARQYLVKSATARPLLLQACGGAPITEETLLFKALHWLSTSSSRDAHTHPIPHDEPEAVIREVLDRHVEDIVAFLRKPQQATMRRWQAWLWRSEPIREKAASRLPKEAVRRLDQARRVPPSLHAHGETEREAIAIHNAGTVALWPLLPDLFRRLGLWDGKQFVGERGQEQAANWLDWLIWQDAPFFSERIQLTRLLCGLSPDEAAAPMQVDDEERRSLIEAWLARLPLQLPGWRTLKPQDVRALFLRRPGVLTHTDAGIVLEVEAQPFDVMLRDWPWPLTSLILPWVSEPISIGWPLPEFDIFLT